MRSGGRSVQIKQTVIRLRGLLTKPKQAIPEILAEGSLGEAANVVLLAAVLGGLSAAVYSGQEGIAASDATTGVIAQLLRPFLTWLLWTCVIYALACLMRGKGKMRPLLMLFGYIMVLDVISSLYMLLCSLIGFAVPAVLEPLRMSDQFLSTVLWIGSFVLAGMSVHEAMKLSAPRCVIVILVPTILLALILLAVFVAFAGAAAGM